MALEIACQHKARELRYKAPNISNAVAWILLSILFHTKYPDRVGVTFHIFLFPDLSISAVSEDALLARRWYKALDSSTLTTYTNTPLLIQLQKVAPIIKYKVVFNMLDKWEVLLTVILGSGSLHPALCEITMLIGTAEEVNYHLHNQER